MPLWDSGNNLAQDVSSLHSALPEAEPACRNHSAVNTTEGKRAKRARTHKSSTVLGKVLSTRLTVLKRKLTLTHLSYAKRM